MAAKDEKFLTVREVSERTGAAIPTVNLWCRSGRLSGAHRETSPYGEYWQIPESAIEGIVVRGRGRPPNASPAPEKRATAKKNASNGASTGKKKASRKK